MTGPRRDPDWVRPYIRARGSGSADHDLRLETLVIAANSPTSGLDPDARRTVELCRGGALAVADIAVGLDLPPSAAKVIISGLIEAGHLTTPAAQRLAADAPPKSLLKEVLDGLRRSIV